MVLVGLYVMRFNRGAAEYFKGGNRIPWLVAGLSCFMAGFSAWTFTGAAGGAFPVGGGGPRFCFWNGLCFLFRLLFFSPRLLASPVYPGVGEFFRRFQP